MAIWYVNPLSTSTTGIGTYANPFGIMDNTRMDAYVNNGDEIRIIGKDITTLSTYNWTMKPYKVNDKSTSYIDTSNGLGLRVNSGTVYLGTSYIIYCVELDMFCSLTYNSTYFTYYMGSSTATLDYLLELNNLPLNTILTFHAIQTTNYNLAQSRYLCCFTVNKSYLNISDNWTSETTRSTGINKIGSYMLYTNSSQYYTFMFQNIDNSIIDCSNTSYVCNTIGSSYNDILLIGPINKSTISLKNVTHSNPAGVSHQTQVNLTNNCFDLNLNIKYFTPVKSGVGSNYTNSKIYLPNNGSNTNFINITIDHYFATWDSGIRFHYQYKQNLTYTINNIIFAQVNPNYHMTTEPCYYAMFGLLTSFLSDVTKSILNIGRIYLSPQHFYSIITDLPDNRYYVFDSEVKSALESGKIDINLLNNFDIVYSAVSIDKKTPYYSNGIPLYIPEYKYAKINVADDLYTTNMSDKTLFIESVSNGVIYVKTLVNNGNITTEYDFQKNSNSPLRIKQYTISSNTLTNQYPNFVGNFSANDAIIIKNNNKILKFIPINSQAIVASDTTKINVMKVEEDNITYKTIAPSISIYPYADGKSSFNAGKSLFKHSLNVTTNKLYNLKFSIYTPGFNAGEIILKVIDDEKIYPITLNNNSLNGWETINFDNYLSGRDQYLTIVIELNINVQKCKLTLSDIILTQLN